MPIMVSNFYKMISPRLTVFSTQLKLKFKYIPLVTLSQPTATEINEISLNLDYC